MTERDEQGFVKDIKVAIDAVSNENKSSKEKVRELIELPFSVEDVLDVVNFVNQETSEEVDVRDELYNLAILNEQLNGFDEMFKSKLEERHNDLVEALMNRMEGVFKMYDENVNENVPAVDPTVEQPVEVQTPQLEEFSPENLAEPMEVEATEPVATLDAPEMVAPTVDPTQFAEPTAYGEVPEMVAPEMEMPAIEPVMPEETPVENNVPSFEEFINNNNFEVPAAEEVEAPVEDTVPSFEDFINNNEFEVPASEEVETPVEDTVPSFEEFINSNNFEAPAPEEVETPVENEVPAFSDFINNIPEVAYEEPEETPVAEEEVEIPVEEPTVEVETTDEDEEVREIINRYDRLKELEINVHNNQKRLAQLQDEAEQVKNDISNDQEEIKRLVA